jgi:septum site-determining protein MinC
MTMNEKSGITIKGIKNGILVEFDPDADWQPLVANLAKQIDAKKGFFTGVNVTLHLGDRSVSQDALTDLQAMLSERGLPIWSIMTGNAITIEAAHALDLKTNVANTVPSSMVPPAEDAPPPGEACITIHRTLRSGQRIQGEGHIFIIGDVNPGAEVQATGNVIVWGRLRGTVHAGSDGREDVIVCALDMSPTQLRIAEHIVTSPEDNRRSPQPEIALIRDRQIVVESWR